MINNRGFDDGDFGTPERDWDDSVNSRPYFDTPVEACQSVGYQSWGYRVDEDYYTDAHLIRSIQKVLAKGGNYLLNVGPKSDGTIPDEARAIVRRVGQWYLSVKESLLDVEPAGMLTSNRDVLLTRRGTTLYVHLHKEPEKHAAYLPPMVSTPRKATLLNSGEPVEADLADLPRLNIQNRLTPSRCLRLRNLPVGRIPSAGLVVKLEYDRLP